MIDAKGALSLGFLVATAGLYTFVGWTVSRRRIGGDAQLASDAFAAWWFGLAILTAQGVLTTVLFHGGVRDVAAYLALTHLALLVLAATFWGLTYYLVFLFTGTRRWLVPTIVYWAILYFALVYLITARQPIGVEQVGSSARLAFAMEASRPFSLAVGVAAIGPILAGAIAYARLFFRVEEPTQRYRIGLVAGSLSGWFLTLLLGSVVTVADEALNAQDWWVFVSRGAALVAALLVLLAYRPPRTIRERFGIRRIDDPTG